MAKANPTLINALRKTIGNLNGGAAYQWGHMGSCNCGNLAQELTFMTKDEIHRHAMSRSGDWNDQLLEYCPSSGYPMDLMISRMLDKGLSIQDLKHLERLSDPLILAEIPFERRMSIEKNRKEDVILYLEKWLEILEIQLNSVNPHEARKKSENIKKEVFA